MRDSLLEVLDMCCVNKDGKGDGTGTIPAEALETMADYFIGVEDYLREKRELAIAHFQTRCASLAALDDWDLLG